MRFEPIKTHVWLTAPVAAVFASRTFLRSAWSGRHTARLIRASDFLLIGRNAWLSQQISLNSTMKNLGTKLIEVLLWFV